MNTEETITMEHQQQVSKLRKDISHWRFKRIDNNIVLTIDDLINLHGMPNEETLDNLDYIHVDDLLCYEAVGKEGITTTYMRFDDE